MVRLGHWQYSAHGDGGGVSLQQGEFSGTLKGALRLWYSTQAA